MVGVVKEVVKEVGMEVCGEGGVVSFALLGGWRVGERRQVAGERVCQLGL